MIVTIYLMIGSFIAGIVAPDLWDRSWTARVFCTLVVIVCCVAWPLALAYWRLSGCNGR